MCPKTIRSYQNLRGSLQLFLRFGTNSKSSSKKANNSGLNAIL
ncbi:hypothetical protein LEP1GSC133_3082 [Leptospira borgpetersenii serovar Pomona str. 200901868]|uniref:Uncharacterized protein n=1 Tax=Leptospira borgpetersenii serovar Pomona str. 200901868 TaxID=1192866 RepID=M6WAV9_LEPBO|nr:hypothetical protein LEP1GSC133_3082 [Leptospira borgpetersenii serovar Pomona str. 200901868]